MSKVAQRKRSPQPPPAPEARAAAAPDCGPRYVWCGPTAGVRVDEFTVLKVAATVACVRFIATQIAQVDYNVYERLDGGGKKYRPDHDVDWVLDKQANPETPAMVFWETMLLHALLWGDAYAEILFTFDRRVQWLAQLTPDKVELRRNAAGEQEYVYRAGATETVLPAWKVFHLRGLSWDGQVGYNVARLCRDVFGGAIAAQDFGNAFFGNDATPGGILTTDQTLSQPAVDRMKATWRQQHGGPARSHLLAVLEEGLRYQQITANAEQAQLVQTQQFQVEQVARVFGVPLTKIGHMLHSGNRANMEEDDRAAYKQCLRPWARKIECEADVKLFGRVNRGRLFTLHDFSVLLRGNSEQMTNQACQLLDRGVLDVNEARDLYFDLNPIPKAAGGQTRPFPRNFTILEKAGEDPPAAAKAGGTPGDSPGAGRNNAPKAAQVGPDPARVLGAFAPLLADAYGRLLRVEADKAKRAGNKDQLGSHIVGYYADGGEAHVADAVRPVLEAALLALGRPADAAADLARRCAADHVTRSVRELSEGTWCREWANGRARHQADDHLQALWESS